MNAYDIHNAYIHAYMYTYKHACSVAHVRTHTDMQTCIKMYE